jgi:alpha-N-acetylglucosaminidase
MTILSVVQNWVEAYSARRYGKSVADARTAWKILHQSIYNCSDGIAVTFPYLSPYLFFIPGDLCFFVQPSDAAS